MNELDKALEPKSDQLNADDLIGTERTIVITDVKIKDSDQPIIISYEGDNGKPWKPCKSMGRVLRYVWKNDYKSWIGNSVTLFNDTNVTWAGVKVGGVRISHVSGITKAITIPLTKSKGKKIPYTVKPIETGETLEMDKDEYLCILADVETAETKSVLDKVNVAQYKNELSPKQAAELREAYKERLNHFKQEEPPV